MTLAGDILGLAFGCVSKRSVRPRSRMSTLDDVSASSLRTRPSLLLRVRDWNDVASWNEFHRLYRKLVYGLARRSGLSHADAEDVTQEVFKRVAETIHQFESDPQRGTFRGWLMTLTRWRIADKRVQRSTDGPPSASPPGETNTGTRTIERVPAPEVNETEWENEWQQHLLDMACERLARRVKERHFQVFELYVRRRWPVLEVTRALGTNPASVYLIGSRLTRQLKTEVARLREQLD